MCSRILLPLLCLLLCLGTAGLRPARGGDGSGPQKVYPFSLRYRQKIRDSIRLLLRKSPCPPPTTLTANALPSPPGEEPDSFPSGIARLPLLMRLQF